MTKEQKALLSWMIVMLLLLAVVGTAAFTVPAFLEAERVIYVEKPGTAAKTAGEATTPSVPKEKIPLNTATAEQLMTIPGIGEGYAARILEYREQNGRFHSVDELMNIKGVGEKRFAKWSPYLSVD